MSKEGHKSKRERMRLRRSVRMEERSQLAPGPVQETTTQAAEARKLKLQQENREWIENTNSKAQAAGEGSLPSRVMRGELQGGSCDSGAARPGHVDNLEIPPSPPPHASSQLQGPHRAAFGISEDAQEEGLALDNVKFKQIELPGDCLSDRKLSSPSGGKNSAEGRINDSHDPHGVSKKFNLDPVDPGPVPTGSHRSLEVDHGSQLQMPRANLDRSGLCTSIPWVGPPCSRCKSTTFSVLNNGMHYQCNHCKLRLCSRENVRSYKHSGSRSKVVDRAKKGASQHTRRGSSLHRTIQEVMSNRERTKRAASNLNMKAMPPPSSSNMTAMRPPSNPNMKLMPPPSYTRKPNALLPGSQDNAVRSALTTLPPRSSSSRDDHSSKETNLQLVVAPELELQSLILEAMGPLPFSENLQEPPSNQSSEGNQNEPALAEDVYSVKGLDDSNRDHPISPLEENKEGSGGSTLNDDGCPSNTLPCPRCKSANTRFCWVGRYYCDNCREYWTLGHLQQHEVQLPAKQSLKGKEKEKETPSQDADQFSGKNPGDSGPRSLPWHASEDSVGGSHEGPLNALSCSRCKSTFTRLCTYGVFCDSCGKYTPFEQFEGTPDCKVPSNPPVRATVHEVFDVVNPRRSPRLQSLPPPPPRKPIMVDASTETNLVAILPLDSRVGKHIVHGLSATHNY